MTNSLGWNLRGLWRLVVIMTAMTAVLSLLLCSKGSPTGTDDPMNPDDTIPQGNGSLELHYGVSNSYISISWNDDDSLDYVLYWSEEPGVSTSDNAIRNVTSPYLHDGLESEKSYYYRVAIVEGSKVIELSDELKVTTFPVIQSHKILMLYASGGDKKVVLFWEDFSDPVNCNVYWSHDSSFAKEEAKSITVHENPYVHTGLSNDTTYFYRVALVDDDGREGELSVLARGYPRKLSGLPEFPTNVRIQERNTMLTVSWAPEASATSYYLYWATSPGIDKNCSREKCLDNYLHFANLENGTTYFIRVSAANDEGEGQLSKETSGTPQTLKPPEQLEATPKYESIVLSWSSVSNALSYDLTCSSSGTDETETFTNVRSPFTHSNLSPKEEYRYYIVSVNLDGRSSSRSVTASPVGLQQPGRPFRESREYRELIIAWHPVDYADSYILYWDDSANVENPTLAVDVGTDTTFTHSDLIPQKFYYYRVQAVKGSDTSECSNELGITAGGLAAPEGLRLTAGYKEITVDIDSTYELPGTNPVTFNLYWSDSGWSSLGPEYWSRTAEVVEGITLPYTLKDLQIDHNYRCCLSVVDGEFEGDFSDMRTLNTLDLMPPDSLALQKEYRDITVTWKSAEGADSYNVYWANNDSVTDASEKITVDSAPFIHSDLTIGETYYYRVASVDGDYESELSRTRGTAVTALRPPSFTLRGDVNSVVLSWKPVTSAESYIVYWSETEDVTTSSSHFSSDDTSFIHGDLSPATKYWYAVSSVNRSDESALSAVKSTVTYKLLPPGSLQIESGYRSVHISWNAAQYAESYTVYRSTDEEVNTSSTKSSATEAIFDFNDLDPLTTYYFKVSSVKGSYESDLSGTVEATTGGLVPPDPVGSTAYRALSLTWNSVPFAESYMVSWSDTTHDVGPVSTETVDDTTFNLENLEPVQDYHVSITAVRGDDESTPSEMLTLTTRGWTGPENLRIARIYKGNMISWDGVNGADSYTLYWSDTSFGAGTIHAESTVDTFYSHENLTPNKSYWYRVTYSKDSEESEPSSVKSGTSGGLTPPTLGIMIWNTSVRLSASSSYAEVIYIYWSWEDDVTTASDTLIKNVNEDYIYHSFDNPEDIGKTRYYRAVAVRGEEMSELSRTYSIEIIK
ncbi:MAG: fibronectin type III domain-containing protein [Chitinispirillaceae bacterium]|nr:fibronectin type III domain-containing protein [Chitinispirillaceae bacterium]